MRGGLRIAGILIPLTGILGSLLTLQSTNFAVGIFGRSEVGSEAIHTLGAKAGATTPSGEHAARITIILAPGLSIHELRSLLQPIPAVGDSGFTFLTPTTAGGTRPEHAYLTLGSGAPARMPNPTLPAMDRGTVWKNRTVESWYREWTGHPPGKARILVPSLAEIQEANRGRSPRVIPGRLGGWLANYGWESAVFGHADGLERNRWAAVAAMDEQGRVAHGQLEGMERHAIQAVGETTLDWEKVVQAWLDLPPKVRLVWIESGDLLKLDQSRFRASPQQGSKFRVEALQRLREGVDRLLEAAETRPGRNPIWILSPSPGNITGSYEGLGMLWIGVPGPSSQPAALNIFTSPSTRRLGLIALTDLAPTIVEELGLPLGSGWVGRPARIGMTIESFEAFLEAASQWEDELLANHRSRRMLLEGYVLSLIGMLVAALAAGWWHPLRPTVRILFPPAAAMPLIFLLLPVMGVYNGFARVATSIAFAVGIAMLARIRNLQRNIFLYLGCATILAVVFDLAAGSPWSIRSPLGYSLLSGARYYGVGNEYAGILIGCTAVVTGLLYDRRERVCERFVRSVVRMGVVLLPVAVAFGLLLPGAGANFGAGTASTLGFSLLILRLLHRPESPQHRVSRRLGYGSWFTWLLPVGSVAVILSVTILTEPLGTGNTTHIGRAFEAGFTAGDPSALLEIIERKLSLNWRLFRSTIWSRVFLLSLTAVAYFVFRPASGFRDLERRRPGLAGGVVGGTIGAIAALFLNDSGVVAAATTMVFPTMALLHTLYESQPSG